MAISLSLVCVCVCHLGVSGLRAAGPPSKLRPLLGLFCLPSREPADPIETALANREPGSGEMREESMYEPVESEVNLPLDDSRFKRFNSWRKKKGKYLNVLKVQLEK